MTQSMSQFRNVNQITKIVEKTQLGLLGNSLGVTVDSDLTYTRSRLVQTRQEDAFSNTVHPDVALCCQPMSSHRAFIVAQPPHTEQSLSLLQICSWHQDTFNTETKIWSHEIMKAVENSVSQRVGCENNCGWGIISALSVSETKTINVHCCFILRVHLYGLKYQQNMLIWPRMSSQNGQPTVKPILSWQYLFYIQFRK